jgi:hypothetical protein
VLLAAGAVECGVVHCGVLVVQWFLRAVLLWAGGGGSVSVGVQCSAVCGSEAQEEHLASDTFNNMNWSGRGSCLG